MLKSPSLPVDRRGFTHILFSALGGDGANMAAKLLFRVAVADLGLDGAYDAKYGSEKTGTATDVSLHLCRNGVRVRASGPTNRPHVLVVFHPDMIRPLALGRGLRPGATVICNSTAPPPAMRELLELHSGTILCLDAERIARESGSRLNMPLMAVAARSLAFPPDAVLRAIEETWPAARTANLAAFRAVDGAVTQATFEDDGRYPLTAPLPPDGPIGYRNMLDGGAIDARYYLTAGRDNRIAGRGLVPVLDSDACIGCAICLSVCSDPGGLTWEHGRVTGIDTAFCKGCMRCVDVCPATRRGQALTLPLNAPAAALEAGS